MSVIYRTPIRSIYVNGTQLSNLVEWNAAYSFSNRVATATISVVTKPTWLRTGMLVNIYGGASPSGYRQRFVGYVIEPDSDLQPLSTKIQAYGYLVKAQMYQNSNPGGTDLALAGVGQTDVQMKKQVLTAAGLANASINGLGVKLGTLATDQFMWNEGEGALDWVDQFEQVGQGYTTFDVVGGVVCQRVSIIPSQYFSLTFTEGVDIERAGTQEPVNKVYNRAKVTGYSNSGGTQVTATVQATCATLPGIDYITQPIDSSMIERSLASDPGLGMSCQDVGTWFVSEYGQVPVKISFRTPRDDFIMPGTVIRVVSPERLGLSQNFVVVGVTPGETGGHFYQDLDCAGTTGAQGSIVMPPVCQFSVLVDVERVIIAGVVQTIYVVYCEDTSYSPNGSISTRAWSSSGTPTSGSDSTYTTVYASAPTGQSITLTVTDSFGVTATATKLIDGEVNPIVRNVRKLYAGNKQAEEYDTSAWDDVSSTNSVDVFACTNGPIWAAGNQVISSQDDLQTVTRTNPFGGAEQTSAIWVETDVDFDAVLIGSNLGRLALSSDGGLTWRICSGTLPDGGPVIRCIINRNNPLEYTALTPKNYYYSSNAGANWSVRQAALAGETFTDVSASFARTMISINGGSRIMIEQAGQVQSFPVGVTGIAAVVPDIRKDRFFCVNYSGSTYTHDADSSNNLVAAVALPAGSVVHERILWRDGAVRKLIYIAAGTFGAWKSVDGFATAGGYYQLRKPGVDGCSASADYRQIGCDGNLDFVPIASTTIFTQAGQEKVFAQGLPPWGLPDTYWYLPSYSDSAWANSVLAAAASSSFYPPPSPSQQVAPFATGAGSNARFLLRKTFTLPSGAISFASISYNYDDYLIGLWINGTFFASDFYPSTSRHNPNTGALNVAVPPSLLVPGGSNVIAMQVENTNQPSSPFAASFVLEVN